MIRAVQNRIEPLAKLLTECFINDPLIIAQIQGIPDQKEFLEKLFQIQLGVLIKTQDVFILDDKLKSVIIGYEKKNFIGLRQIVLNILSALKFWHLMGKKDFILYSANVKAAAKIVDSNWHKQFFSHNYYHINIIAVTQEERGKGNLRALIAPIVQHCNEKNIPIVLETVNSKQIAMYEHLGFNLVKTLADEGNELKQHCFIRY